MSVPVTISKELRRHLYLDLSMETPRRHGKPVTSWYYWGRPCHVYHTGAFGGLLETAIEKTGSPLEEENKIANQAHEMMKRSFCAYTKTTLTGNYDEIPARVYGGLTYGVTKGWVGFDNMHGQLMTAASLFGEQFDEDRVSEELRIPTNPESMKSEIEDLIPQLIELERSQ